jgi:hypothetical protein
MPNKITQYHEQFYSIFLNCQNRLDIFIKFISASVSRPDREEKQRNDAKQEEL